MLVKKEFKGQVHIFNLPDDQALSLLKKDNRYSVMEQDVGGLELEQDQPKRRGRKANVNDSQ